MRLVPPTLLVWALFALVLVGCGKSKY